MEDNRTDNHVVELDVRDMLRKKQEPFQLIKSTVESLKPDDDFVLHATFKPLPLLTYMKRKGFDHEVEHVDKGHWIVTFYQVKGEKS